MKSLSVRMGVILGVVGLLIFVCSIAFAFDIDGFKSGMTKEEVKRKLNEWKGFKIEEEPRSIRIRSSTDPTALLILNFCNDKLCELFKTLNPSMKNFILLFNQFSGIYGHPFNSHSKIEIDSIGENRQISFYWRAGTDVICLTYHVFPNNDQLDISYRTEKSFLKEN